MKDPNKKDRKKTKKRAQKSHETDMKRLKEDVLLDSQLCNSFPTNNSTPSTSSPTDNTIPSTSSSTGNSITRFNDSYIYDVCVVAVLPIGACLILHITRNLLRLQINKSSRNKLW